jgi:hypothetical protein
MRFQVRRPSLALRAFVARNGSLNHFVRFADRSSRGKKPITRVLVSEL